MLKKKKNLFLIIVLIFGLFFSACGNKEMESSNSKERSQEYMYDFIDYIDVSFIGANGHAVINVTSADYSANDFEKESDFISVKKVMDSLNLNYIYGNEEDNDTYLTIDKVENIENGDIITLSVNTQNVTVPSDITINFEDYQIEVSGLTEGKNKDIFNDNFVTFYGIEGTQNVGYYFNEQLSDTDKEIAENLEYEITVEDEEMKEKSTIINVSAKMKEEFLKENNYSNFHNYMLKHNYIYQLETETVIDKIAKQVDFESSSKIKVKQLLDAEYIGADIRTMDTVYRIDEIGNIQKTIIEESDNDLSAYLYDVTFHAISEVGEGAFRVSMYLFDIDGEIRSIQLDDEFSTTSVDSLSNTLGHDKEIVAQYYLKTEATKEADNG